MCVCVFVALLECDDGVSASLILCKNVGVILVVSSAGFISPDL